MFSSHMWVKPDVWPHFWHLKPSQTSETKNWDPSWLCLSSNHSSKLQNRSSVRVFHRFAPKACFQYDVTELKLTTAAVLWRRKLLSLTSRLCSSQRASPWFLKDRLSCWVERCWASEICADIDSKTRGILWLSITESRTLNSWSDTQSSYSTVHLIHLQSLLMFWYLYACFFSFS